MDLLGPRNIAWISPDGDILPVEEDMHSKAVVKYPERFGLDPDKTKFINSVSAVYSLMFKKGYVRVGYIRDPNGPTMYFEGGPTRDTRDIITSFIGIHRESFPDNMTITVELSDGYQKTYRVYHGLSISDVVRDSALYESKFLEAKTLPFCVCLDAGEDDFNEKLRKGEYCSDLDKEQGFSCTRPKGHGGNHVACIYGGRDCPEKEHHYMKSWPNKNSGQQVFNFDA